MIDLSSVGEALPELQHIDGTLLCVGPMAKEVLVGALQSKAAHTHILDIHPMSAKVARRASGASNVNFVQALLAERDGEAEYFEYNLPFLNGTQGLESLRERYPGIKVEDRRKVRLMSAETLHDWVELADQRVNAVALSDWKAVRTYLDYLVRADLPLLWDYIFIAGASALVQDMTSNDGFVALLRAGYGVVRVREFSPHVVVVAQRWKAKISTYRRADEPVIVNFLRDLHERFPHQPEPLVALAEAAQRRGRYSDAIRYWQYVASLLQDETPQTYYDRLDSAYQLSKGFNSGTPEEEEVRGQQDKHELLAEVHRVLRPGKYLEIGVQAGVSFRLAKCESIGVDPMPWPGLDIGPKQRIFRMTSDAFFDDEACTVLTHGPDLVFIDGMHLFEFVLRDFMNVERYAKEGTVVLVDDVLPGHPAQAERDRRTRAWAGDVWRLHYALEKYRPDLKLELYDVHPTGLLSIRGLNPNNNTLQERYDEILGDVLAVEMSYEVYVERRFAQPPQKLLET